MKRFDGVAFLRLLGIALVVWIIAATLCVLGGSTGRFGVVSFDTGVERLTTYVLPASIIGAALAAAGVAYQAVLRNPLADPYLLGVSSGATLAAYVWRLPLAAAVPWIAGSSPHLFALAGSILAVAAVLGVLRRSGRIDPTTAVLAGVIVNALCGSAFMLLNAIFRDPPGSGGMLTFLVGDIQTSAAKRDVWLSTAMMAAGIVALWPLTTSLNAVRLSEDEAASLGVNVHRARWLSLGIASIITAAAVAISGPIGFVGLVCPHIARFFVGNDNRRLLIVSVALGASMLALANLLSRMLLGTSVGTLVPVGVITSMVVLRRFSSHFC
ncbi:MAG: iron ABC transporter permease [Tepidisphaeraceae bacterium]